MDRLDFRQRVRTSLSLSLSLFLAELKFFNCKIWRSVFWVPCLMVKCQPSCAFRITWSEMSLSAGQFDSRLRGSIEVKHSINKHSKRETSWPHRYPEVAPPLLQNEYKNKAFVCGKNHSSIMGAHDLAFVWGGFNVPSWSRVLLENTSSCLAGEEIRCLLCKAGFRVQWYLG